MLFRAEVGGKLRDPEFCGYLGDILFNLCHKPVLEIPNYDVATKPVKKGGREASAARGYSESGNDPQTILFPLDSNEEMAQEQRRCEALAILGGEKTINSYKYKIEHVFDKNSGKMLACCNMNYIQIPCTSKCAARLYAQKNSGLNIPPAAIESELDTLAAPAAYRVARLLPVFGIPLEDIQQARVQASTKHMLQSMQVAVERFRSELTRDPRCVVATVPAIIQTDDSYFILVQELQRDGAAMLKELIHELKCEETPEMDIVLFESVTDRPHCPKSMHIGPRAGRKLCIPNVLAKLRSEDKLVTDDVRILLEQCHSSDSVLEWGKGSELESISRHFRDNAVDAHPWEYTTQARYDRLKLAVPVSFSGMSFTEEYAMEELDHEKSAREAYAKAREKNSVLGVRSAAAAAAPSPTIEMQTTRRYILPPRDFTLNPVIRQRCRDTDAPGNGPSYDGGAGPKAPKAPFRAVEPNSGFMDADEDDIALHALLDAQTK